VSHARQAIREAVVAALTGLPTTGGSVKDTWPYATPPEDMPALRIYTPGEQADDRASDLGPIQGRAVTLLIVGYAEGVLVAETLDTIAAEVEVALAASGNLGGLVKLIDYQSMTALVEGETKKRSGEIRLTYSILYRTARADPTATVR